MEALDEDEEGDGGDAAVQRVVQADLGRVRGRVRVRFGLGLGLVSSRATTTLTTATRTRADLAEELHQEERVP